jgi:putative ABC transport system ATP-binding protein
MLTLQNISKTFPGAARPVLEQIRLELAQGEYIAIMGESGTGKSTLLNLIAGLDVPDSGQIRIDGQDLARMDDAGRTRLRREAMGFIFQAFHLLPYLTVRQNVMLPLLFNHDSQAQREQQVAAMLNAVGLGQRLHSSPRELSGGEMQRVAIARALVHRPRLILADEPTGNLDEESAAQVLHLIRSQMETGAHAGILVTHSLSAAQTADRIYLLTRKGLTPK